MINTAKILTKEEYEFCEYWLRFPTTLFANLTSPVFPQESISAMVVYEMNTRKRKHVLDRLIGRYYRMVRKNDLKRILKLIERSSDDSGEQNRAVPTVRSPVSRWPSD